jgi:hypothetical protein
MVRQKEKEQEELAARQRLEEEKKKMEDEERGQKLHQKEKEQEDLAVRQRLEEEKKKAEAAAARLEEAKEKAKVAAAKEKIPAVDVPDENINDHLNSMNSGGGMNEETEVDDGEGEDQDDGTKSPVKKKKKSNKTDKRKEKKSARKEKESTSKKTGKKRGKPAEDRGEDPVETGGSAMRGGRFSAAGKASGKKTQVNSKPPHDHKYKREYVEGSAILSHEDDRHTELTMKLRGLLKEGQKVDPNLIIMPLKEGHKSPVITTPNEIPLNQTDLGSNVNIDAKAVFEKRRPWGKDSDIPEEDWPDPEIWFSFVISSDEPPEDILERIRHEWKKCGGNRLGIKELKTHHPEGSIVLYHMYNQGNEESIMAEGKRILEKAKEEERNDAMGDDFKWAFVDIPEFTLALRVPNIPGQDTSKMNKMSWQMKMTRKAFHMICDRKQVSQLQDLMAVAKDRNLIAPVWGKQVKPSNAIVKGKGKGKNTPSWQITNLKSFTKHHVNFHASMTAVGFEGIWDLDKEVAIYNVINPLQIEGFVSLRTVMYSKLKLSDGHSLVAEMHQKQEMGDVEAVVPNMPEAETMVEMINKNVVAYLTHYLKDEGMPANFVTNLLKASCDPSLFHNLAKCKWNKEKKMLTTPEDEERAKEAAMQNAAWYKNDFGAFMDSPQKKKGGGNNQVDPEHIYDLDGTHSVKSIRERPEKGKKYGGSPGAPAFQVGGEQKQKQTVIELDDKDEEMDLSGLTRQELIARLQKASISEKPKGSAPISENKKSYSNSEEEESTSTKDGSSGSEESESPSGSSAEQSNESQNGTDSG